MFEDLSQNIQEAFRKLRGHGKLTDDDINKALKRHLSTAYDPQESSGYHGNMTIHKDIICKNRDEAMQMIQRLDRGWYDDHAVRYKAGRKMMWLVKYEYHC